MRRDGIQVRFSLKQIVAGESGAEIAIAPDTASGLFTAAALAA